MMKQEMERINKMLLVIGGKNITGIQLHRIVWSDTQTEKRRGTFRDHDENGTFIREVTEVRECKRYPHIQGRHIYEKWAEGPIAYSPELPDSVNGDYIIVYVFESGEGKALPVTERSVRFINSFLSGRIDKDEVPSEEYFAEKAVQQNFDEINNHPTFTTTPGVTRDSVAYDRGLKNVQL